jgi:hypothetical protein
LEFFKGDEGKNKSMKANSSALGSTLLRTSLAALPPFSTDLYLSILSVIGKFLGSTPSAVGYTVSVFLGTFGISQFPSTIRIR